MSTLRTAVVGVGYLGAYHAEKYAALPQSQLIGVCDIDPERARLIASHTQVTPYTRYQDLLGQVDAVSIAVPTPAHFDVGQFFLSHGVHVLLEKPIATTVEQAEQLITTAKQTGAILQIGHLERYNNVIKALGPYLTRPMYIESSRLAPFRLRGTDVNVILDLMIHDIDIIQSIVDSPITEIRANGAPILSPHYVDIANARIEFANRCVANVSASRVSVKTERRLRIYQPDSYVGMDLHQKKFSIHRKGKKEMFPGIPEITSEEHTFEHGDALKEEIVAFLTAIIDKTPPMVSGEEGKRALATAIKITQIVRQQLDHYQALADTMDA